jgi:DNA-binding CsgD family transcriptional regulator
VELVVEASAGLPLLAEELFAGLVEGRSLVAGTDGWERTTLLVTPIPPSLVGLVASRLARLAPEDIAVVAAAAVSGDPGDWRLLVEATGQEEDHVLAALRGAVTAHLLTADGPRLAWRHALTREAVLASLPGPDLDIAREHVAGALAARSDDDASTARAAELWAAAGDDGTAITMWRALARRHELAGRLTEAERLLARAAECGGSALVAGDRVRVLTQSGHVAAALDVGTSALSQITGDDHADLCLALAAAAVEAADWPQALAYVERSGRPADTRSRVVRGDALFGSGDLEGARAVASGVVAESDAQGGLDPPTLCSALEIVGRCDRASDPAAARASFTRAAQVAAENGLLTRRVRALHSLGTLELMTSQSAPSLDEARRTAEEIGMLATVAAVDLMLGDVRLLVDGPASGAAHADRAAQLASRLGMVELSATADLLRDMCRAWGGADPDHLPSSHADDAAGPPDRRGHVAAMGAIPAFLAHDQEAAARHLDEAVSIFGAHSAGAPLTTWGLWALLRTAVDRDGAGARQFVRGSQAGLRGANEAAVLFAEAVEAGRAGRPDDAVTLQRRAERELHDAPWWSRVLRVPVHQAALTDGWGHPVDGLRADLRAFESGGDRQLARICRDLLRSAGVVVRRGRGDSEVPPHLGARGVTSREMDVLLLVAAGATNTDAATRLHLSARTVEHHVGRLLVKLGAANRTELRPWIDARS